MRKNSSIIEIPQNHNNSVFKTFRILSVFSQEKDQLTLAEISKETGINKTTAYRFLKSLTEIGVVYKNSHKNTYQLGIVLYELGNKVNLKSNLIDLSHPLLLKLVKEIDITVHLATLDNFEVLYLDKIKSKKTLQMSTFIGARAPAYCTALGKSILAFLKEDELKHYLTSCSFKKRTKNTLGNKDGLIKQLQIIRKKGYAIDKEEFEEGLYCLAVPVFDSNEYPIASISISGTPLEISNSKIIVLQKRLKNTANKITNILEILKINKFARSKLNSRREL